MPLKQQVTSLELSQKLKELGVKQESHFYWTKPWYGTMYNVKDYFYKEHRAYSAFTVAELGEMLLYRWSVEVRHDSKQFLVCHPLKGEIGILAETEADARAKMLIYLLENKLITL